MYFSLFTLLTLSLAPLTLARPTQTIIACLSFTGHITPQSTIFINETTTIQQPYTVTGTLLSSSRTDPGNASTLAVVCTCNYTLEYAFFGQTMRCVDGYTARFLWGWETPEVSYTTPTINAFLGQEPAFLINGTVRGDGSGTDWKGSFGCDGGEDTVTAWYNTGA